MSVFDPFIAFSIGLGLGLVIMPAVRRGRAFIAAL